MKVESKGERLPDLPKIALGNEMSTKEEPGLLRYEWML